MAVSKRWLPLPLLLAGLLPGIPAFGQAEAGANPMAAIRAGHWDAAAMTASVLADPAAAKLVAYYRLSSPNGGTLHEIAAFIAANPDWPAPALLDRRRQEALATAPDDIEVLGECDRAAVTLDRALVRCAEAMRTAGRITDSVAIARRAWITGFAGASEEAGFLAHWGNGLEGPDQAARFDALVWSNPAAAERQIARLAPEYRPRAGAWLALRRDDPAAAAMVAALPAGPSDPVLMLEQARSLRRTANDGAATALWLAAGAPAQDAVAGFRARLAEFWNERQRLARQLLRAGNDRAAYDLVSAHGQGSAEAMADAEFLAGFIALRRLGRPDDAVPHFTALLLASRGVISQARANYWLGRAEEATGRNPRQHYEEAAAFPTTFYGQLAALALGEGPASLALRINALRDPGWTEARASALDGNELAHAATLLTGWGEPGRAKAFVLRLDELAPDPSDRSLSARLATTLGLPEVAVTIARRMGRDGIALPVAGWPAPVDPPPAPVDPSIVLGVIRQESSFEVAAVSDKGARGLMQLMPGTAEQMARRLGLASPVAALTLDGGFNMRLGTAYLRTMLERYGGFLPMALAAYNAGPMRVDAWRVENGDPAAPASGGESVNMLDWIELVPVAETRNYIQRVLENVSVYRARRGDDTLVLDARWNR